MKPIHIILGLAAIGGIAWLATRPKMAIAATTLTEAEKREVDYLVHGEGYSVNEATKLVLSERN
jgi:hypothetical protein